MKLLGLMKGVVTEVERKNGVSHMFLHFLFFIFLKFINTHVIFLINNYTCGMPLSEVSCHIGVE